MRPMRAMITQINDERAKSQSAMESKRLLLLTSGEKPRNGVFTLKLN